MDPITNTQRPKETFQEQSLLVEVPYKAVSDYLRTLRAAIDLTAKGESKLSKEKLDSEREQLTGSQDELRSSFCSKRRLNGSLRKDYKEENLKTNR